jgi:hypothetical protein
MENVRPSKLDLFLPCDAIYIDPLMCSWIDSDLSVQWPKGELVTVLRIVFNVPGSIDLWLVPDLHQRAFHGNGKLRLR